MDEQTSEGMNEVFQFPPPPPAAPLQGSAVRQMTHSDSTLPTAWHVIGLQGLGVKVISWEKMGQHLHQVP